MQMGKEIIATTTTTTEQQVEQEKKKLHVCASWRKILATGYIQMITSYTTNIYL